MPELILLWFIRGGKGSAGLGVSYKVCVHGRLWGCRGAEIRGDASLPVPILPRDGVPQEHLAPALLWGSAHGSGKCFAFPIVTSQHLLATFSRFSPTSSAVLLLLISLSSYVFLCGMDTRTLVGWIFLCLPEIVLNGEDIILQHLIISNDFISQLPVARLTAVTPGSHGLGLLIRHIHLVMHTQMYTSQYTPAFSFSPHGKQHGRRLCLAPSSCL